MLLLPLLLAFLCAAGCGAQNNADYVDECPVDNGFFADAVQCDRYYECKNREIIDHLCPDGLVYDESSVQFAKCSFPFSVDCTDRPELQPAQPSLKCPRRNGYFAHEDPKVCDKFYFCVDGVPNPITCPDTLIFDPSKGSEDGVCWGQCAFSDQVTREGCTSEEFFQFTCPNDPGAPHEHPRYPDPTDCQYFYICIGGTQARRNGCQVGMVFNPATLACDRPLNVEGPCRSWYNETFLDSLRGPNNPNRVPGAGNRLNEIPGRRVAVRRRRPQPPPQQETPAFPAQVTPQAVSRPAASDDRRTVPLTRTAQAATSTFAANRNRVRQRVRRPIPSQIEPEVPEIPSGPPQFALSSDEDIQRFRDSNRFVPTSSSSSGGGSGGSRLTVISQRRPAITFEDEPVPRQEPAQFQSSRTRQRQGQTRARTPVATTSVNDGFSSFPAVPVGGDSGAAEQVAPVEPPFHSDPFQTNFAPIGSSARSRAPPQSAPASRSRLEITPINVRPNEELARQEDPADFEIRRLPGRQRQRRLNY